MFKRFVRNGLFSQSGQTRFFSWLATIVVGITLIIFSFVVLKLWALLILFLLGCAGGAALLSSDVAESIHRVPPPRK